MGWLPCLPNPLPRFEMIQTTGIILCTMIMLVKKAFDRLYYPTGAGPVQPPEVSSFLRLSPRPYLSFCYLERRKFCGTSLLIPTFLLAIACGMQDRSSLSRDQTHASCSGSSLNHRTTKEVPDPHLFPASLAAASRGSARPLLSTTLV